MNCKAYATRGSHSWTAAEGSPRDQNGDPEILECRECGLIIDETGNPVPRMRFIDNWHHATMGVTFAPE